MPMHWDAVEREFVVLGAQLERLSRTFFCLASELRKEREFGNARADEGHEQSKVERKSKSDGGPPPGPQSGFWEE